MDTFELALWTRVTPLVLWLRSRATVVPVAVSVSMVGVTAALIVPVLVTLVTLPDWSEMAVALPMSPVMAPLIVPELTMPPRCAPASIRMPVAWEARLVVEPALMVPSFTRVGVVRPDRMWMPVASFWKPEAPMVLLEVMWMPPSMVTRWPPATPSWTAVPE